MDDILFFDTNSVLFKSNEIVQLPLMFCGVVSVMPVSASYFIDLDWLLCVV